MITLHAAEAQSFKRACSCFWPWRYVLLHWTWVDLDEPKRPKTVPKLADWQRLKAMAPWSSPYAEEGFESDRATKRWTDGHGAGHRNGNPASDQRRSLVCEIEPDGTKRWGNACIAGL